MVAERVQVGFLFHDSNRAILQRHAKAKPPCLRYLEQSAYKRTDHAPMANNRNAFVAAVEQLLRQCAAAVPYVRTAFPIGIGNVLLMQLPLCKSVPGNRPRKFSIRRPYRFPAGTYPQYALQAQISAWGRCSPVCTARVRSLVYTASNCVSHRRTARRRACRCPFGVNG